MVHGVNSVRKASFRTLCLWAGLLAIPALVRAVDLLPPGLRDLAASSSPRETWPRLRSYAQSQSDPEWRGWAYFLAGYQEYQNLLDTAAAQDLARAAQSGFSLSDFAVLYQAMSLSQAGRPADAASALQDFAARFPRSHLHDKALLLRVNSLMSAHEAQQTINALGDQPLTRKQPAVALLFAQACSQSHHLLEAAGAYQNVYYNFPASTQAKAAADALRTLALQLGSSYPVPNDDLKLARAEGLFNAGRYPDALKDYNSLLRDEPSSPNVPRWQMGQARCLVRLRRSADGLHALFTHFASPDLEAERMALLVQLHAQQSDAMAMTQDLALFEATHSSSPFYADALSTAGMFYYRQLNWQEAARPYRRLYELFPHNDHLREDGWRLAWCDYLLRDPGASGVISDYLTAYADSPRAPAALYWLGRIQEDNKSWAEARALYALLTSRFVHSYYAPLAAARLAALRTQQGSLAGPNDSAAAPLAATLIPVLAPATAPQGLACLSTSSSDAARPALILQALDLQNVEADFLKGALAVDNPPAELRLLLAGAYAAQKNPSAALFAALRTAPSYSRMEFSDLPKELWDFLFPVAYGKLIESQARLNNLDPYLVMGLVRQESGFNAGALSVANARGLMQLLPQTAARSTRYARMRAAERRLYDPAYNVQSGCAYLAELLKQFDNKPVLAVAAYNAGAFRVRDWLNKSSLTDSALFLESIPFSETRTYTELVLRDAEIYRQLLGGSPHFAQCSLSSSAMAPPGVAASPRGNSTAAMPLQHARLN